MMRKVLVALLMAAATQTPGPRLDIDLVAFDRSGQPVHDIKKDDIEVWIGGLRVPIDTLDVVTVADTERSRRTVVLLLDDMMLPPALVGRAREVARRFVSRLAPGDEMAIVTLNGSGSKSTGDAAELLRTINAYNVRLTGVVRPDRVADHVLKTIASVARQIAETPGRRRAIVAIGASWLFDTPIPPPPDDRDLRPQWTDAIRAMAAANVTFHVIEPAGVGMSRVTSGSDGFARDTGGHAFVNTNDINGAADRIMREMSTYYIVGVADPPIRRASELRELDVRSVRRGVTVRARRVIPGGKQ